MGLNRYRPHVFVLPEDDANRQIANSFILHPELRERVIQVLPPAGGWLKLVSDLTGIHIPALQAYPEERIVLLIDFDLREDRRDYVKQQVPPDLLDRVFVLGVLSEPERLRSELGQSFEAIGIALANDCAEAEITLWQHSLLMHNISELNRMSVALRPLLFA